MCRQQMTYCVNGAYCVSEEKRVVHGVDAACGEFLMCQNRILLIQGCTAVQEDWPSSNDPATCFWVACQACRENNQHQVRQGDLAPDPGARGNSHRAPFEGRVPSVLNAQYPNESGQLIVANWTTNLPIADMVADARYRDAKATAHNLYLRAVLVFEQWPQYRERQMSLHPNGDLNAVRRDYLRWYEDPGNYDWLPRDREGAHQRAYLLTPQAREPQDKQKKIYLPGPNDYLPDLYVRMPLSSKTMLSYPNFLAPYVAHNIQRRQYGFDPLDIGSDADDNFLMLGTDQPIPKSWLAQMSPWDNYDTRYQSAISNEYLQVLPDPVTYEIVDDFVDRCRVNLGNQFNENAARQAYSDWFEDQSNSHWLPRDRSGKIKIDSFKRVFADALQKAGVAFDFAGATRLGKPGNAAGAGVAGGAGPAGAAGGAGA